MSDTTLLFFFVLEPVAFQAVGQIIVAFPWERVEEWSAGKVGDEPGGRVSSLLASLRLQCDMVAM